VAWQPGGGGVAANMAAGNAAKNERQNKTNVAWCIMVAPGVSRVLASPLS